MPVFPSNGAVIAIGSLTKGTRSQGTTTVTTTRGCRSDYVGGYNPGSVTWPFTLVADPQWFGLFTKGAAGAVPVATSTIFDTNNVQLGGSYTTVRVSIDHGTTWATLTWGSDPNMSWNTYCVVGNPLGMNLIADSTVIPVLIELA